MKVEKRMSCFDQNVVIQSYLIMTTHNIMMYTTVYWQGTNCYN